MVASAALDVDLDSPGLLSHQPHYTQNIITDRTPPDSIKTAAKAVASNLMSYYKGDDYGQTPGILPGPPPAGDYYWWEGGALWGTLVDYWHWTGDTTWNSVTQSSLLFQAGAPDNSYQPNNWTLSLGNDDQGFWGMSAMLAAENKFQDPPATDPGWLALAQAVFNTQAAPDRHDDTCGGGLRWQIPPTNVGYDYKNSIANGIFFNLGARLARYTGNTTYEDWAVKTWDWMQGVGLISDDYKVYDGGHVEDNCTTIDMVQFSYCAAVILEGTAFMYNHTNGSDIWSERLQGLVNTTISWFFPNGTAVEPSCELADKVTCDTDMLSFKGYLHRWLATSTQLAPLVRNQVLATLRTSTAAAVGSCTDGVDNGNGVSTATCGFRWTTGTYDGQTGAGQQMNVLGALTSLLVAVDPAGETSAPVTNSTGGTSAGNYGAGGNPSSHGGEVVIGVKDKAGAGIITAVVLLAFIPTMAWASSGWSEGSLVFKSL
ncbi:family 76 glycoside hydrolase [Cryphonectria parasitica EP155]|uniref:Mannan endo-1,6-alpha-mannosidase n=1 Tax=Cryphonectria parasitica (strain ATCC 38755 / EP155) TaxID=660469 RepID=A0A9P5CPX8_CRYP1|nr:family 76 glycoside hydrolase [Cryphonectria parasitica EP155]KAF3766954.1 family 76 glycoside hydrolase [Cryphonectria parasitica EP155]